MTDQIRETLHAYARAWAEDDRDGFLRLFAEDATLEDPVGSPPVEGKQGLADFWDRVHSLGMRYEVEVVRTVCCGEEGVLVFNVTSHAPGVAMKVELVDLFAFNGAGEIQSMRAYWDQGCMSMG